MLRLVLTGIALAFYAVVALAAGGFGGGNNLTGFWQTKSRADPVLAYQDSDFSTSDLTTYSFSMTIGTEAATGHIILAATAHDTATNFSVSSATLGGVGMTELFDTADTGSVEQVAFYIGAKPSGTTATIEATFSEAVSAATFHVWHVTGLNSTTPTATNEAWDTAAASLSVNTNVQAGGIIVGADACQNVGSTRTYTGLTERADIDHVAGGATSGAADYSGAAATPLTITMDCTGTGDAIVATVALR